MADLQELVMDRASDTPKNVGRRLRKLTQKKQREAMEVHHHGLTVMREAIALQQNGQYAERYLVAVTSGYRMITFAGVNVESEYLN